MPNFDPSCFTRPEEDDGTIRKFESGATRDTAEDKYDLEGFLSPLVLDRFAEYMHKNRLQSDGSLRDSDNWQKGIPLPAYMKSKFRHDQDMWKLHRGYPAIRMEKGELVEVDMEEAICGVLFNAMGYLHEVLKAKLETSRAMRANHLCGGCNTGCDSRGMCQCPDDNSDQKT